MSQDKLTTSSQNLHISLLKKQNRKHLQSMNGMSKGLVDYVKNADHHAN